MIIGITGSIGSGKSEVASVFQQEGAICLDADLIAKACLKKGEGGYKAVTSVFGEKIKDEKGCIDKQKLASIVFSDQEKLKTLNALIHPIVHSVIKERIAEIKGENPEAIVVIDAPLLIEAGFHQITDRVILVASDEEAAFRRAAKRIGVTIEEVKKRFFSQLSFSEKAKIADVVILNKGTLRQLRVKAREVYLNITDREEKNQK
jgi:dephospho-CoA kinase